MTSSGAEGDGLSRRAVLSGERYVAFLSDATDLVPGDTNGVRDVFLRDRARLTTRRVSVAAGGTQADGNCFDPSLADGAAAIAFESVATNLVSGDSNGARDIFVRRPADDSTERVSLGNGAVEANGSSFQPSISRDGSRVAFRSDASNLVAGDGNATIDIFVRDLVGGTTTRASVATGGGEGDGPSADPMISGDGRVVVFESAATNLVTGDANGAIDIFVHDLGTGLTQRVSVASDGSEANGDSRAPSVSDDGRFIAFESVATDLVAGDVNAVADIFVHDRVTGTTILVSRSTAGVAGDGGSTAAAISADAGSVAFASDAANLVAGDGNGKRDVFVHDLSSQVTVRASVGTDGVEADDDSDRPHLGDDGTRVAFDSIATTLTPGDTNGVGDVVLRDVAGVGSTMCRTGNVNAGAGVVTDVVFVNGSAGVGAGRIVLLAPDASLEISVAAPPAQPAGPSPFVLYAWLGLPNALTVRELPFSIGTLCMSAPLTGGPPAPREIWNNIGKPQLLGASTRQSSPAPSVVFTRPGGVGLDVSFFVQGILVDPGSSQGQAAVTNGVGVVLR